MAAWTETKMGRGRVPAGKQAYGDPGVAAATRITPAAFGILSDPLAALPASFLPRLGQQAARAPSHDRRSRKWEAGEEAEGTGTRGLVWKVIRFPGPRMSPSPSLSSSFSLSNSSCGEGTSRFAGSDFSATEKRITKKRWRADSTLAVSKSCILRDGADALQLHFWHCVLIF